MVNNDTLNNQNNSPATEAGADDGTFSSLASESQVGREQAALLDNARERLLLSIHGPSADQSFQATVDEAHQTLVRMFQQLPSVLNRPGSENTASGALDTEPLDSSLDPDWERQLKEFHQTCMSTSAQFKARFLQVQRIGQDILSLSRELTPGTDTESLFSTYD